MRKILAAALASAAMIAIATPASAQVLVLDGGWQDDTLSAPFVPTDNSPWSFTITSSAILSVVDCCVTGDTYFLSGDVTGVTTFYAGSASDVQASGAYGSYWVDSAYSKISLLVGPGTYSFSITGDGVGGTPAGLGVRLDSAVPEPAAWGMMIGGFAFAGFAMRARVRKVSYAAA
jgi:hypothetical protein